MQDKENHHNTQLAMDFQDLGSFLLSENRSSRGRESRAKGEKIIFVKFNLGAAFIKPLASCMLTV